MQNYPVTFVVFGATGDLAEKKLFPALFGLYRKKLLPTYFKIVGFARRPFTDESFRELMKQNILAAHADAHDGQGGKNVDETSLDTFLGRIVYHRGLFEEVRPYIALINRLGEIDKELGACSHKVFHLALSPFFYEMVLKNLEASALNLSCTDGTGLTRILIEKPIGTDLASARKINLLLADIFKEEQIFRVDHYLMKNALYDLCTLHLASAGMFAEKAGLVADLLRPLWNADTIESVTITLHEAVTAQGRGSFYDKIGALRDVGQNHLLETLALLLMTTSPAKDDREPRIHRSRIFAELVSTQIGDTLVRAQYDGYLREEGVALASQTETFFRLGFSFAGGVWKGLKVMLESGKALSESRVAVAATFRQSSAITSCILTIQPDPSVELHYANGERKLVPYEEFGLSARPDNYERVYANAMLMDQTRFVGKSEVEASWAFTDRALEALRKTPLIVYLRDADASQL